MNKVKKIFMQNAPTFVLNVGIGSLVAFALMGIVLMFTKEYKFGIFAFILCVAGIITIVSFIYRCEQSSGKSIKEMIENDKKLFDK